jgi:hypothetical protein
MMMADECFFFPSGQVEVITGQRKTGPVLHVVPE